jgi:hypothetical protein
MRISDLLFKRNGSNRKQHKDARGYNTAAQSYQPILEENQIGSPRIGPNLLLAKSSLCCRGRRLLDEIRSCQSKYLENPPRRHEESIFADYAKAFQLHRAFGKA